MSEAKKVVDIDENKSPDDGGTESATVTGAEAPKPQAPRVTDEHVQSVIGQVGFHRFEGTTVTVCIILLKNGFSVLGESACVSPENFDEEKGRELAYNDARGKIWNLEGYLMREKIHHIMSLQSIGGVNNANKPAEVPSEETPEGQEKTTEKGEGEKSAEETPEAE